MTAPTLPEPRPDDEGLVDIVNRYGMACYDHGASGPFGSPAREIAVARRRALWKQITAALTPHPAPLGATDEGLRLVPVDQTRFGAPEGNCLMACVASLTGLPLDVLDAAFPPGEQEGEHWWTLFSTVLHSQGWHPVYIPGADGVVPRGYAIGSGVSPRDLRHAIVVKDGQLTHDPHPSREGATVDGYYVLLPARAALQAGG